MKVFEVKRPGSPLSVYINADYYRVIDGCVYFRNRPDVGGYPALVHTFAKGAWGEITEAATCEITHTDTASALRLTQAQFDELHGYAAIFANAETLTVEPTDKSMTYSLADINEAGTTMLDILDAVAGAGDGQDRESYSDDQDRESYSA